MNILFVTPECAPWVKTGGLGEVAASLPPALCRLGHDVKLLLPAYRSLSGLVARAEPCAEWGPQPPWPAARLLRAPAAVDREAGFTLLLLDCPELFDLPGGPYQDDSGTDHADNARRFGFFSHVAALLASVASPWPAWVPDVLHGHDWTAGLAPAYLSRLPGRAASVMTIHNLAFQGLFPMDSAASLALPGEWLQMDGLEYWGQLSFLKAGLQFADAISTVSPTYALEIQQEPLGFGLQGVLREHAARLRGILNGIDTRVWNPATDPHLPQRYDAASVQEGKRLAKQALQRRLGLQAVAERPLFGTVSRLTAQKGIDLLVQLVPWLVEQGGQFVALGQGDAALEQQLQALAGRHPGQVSVAVGFDEALAHLIEAGADVFLMPSRFEPCGLNQMYSLAYGTPPIVHATGGLADSVRDGETGFCFTPPEAPFLQAAVARALALYRAPAAWLEMQQRGMARRFDWECSARAYEALYREVLDRRR